MATQRRGGPVFVPNLGLYLGVPPLLVPERGMSACNNVRIAQGRVVRDNLGWAEFPNTANAINLDSKPVMLITSFAPRGGVTRTVFANTTDLFLYDTANERVLYLTPREETGTVAVTNASAVVTGTGTSWLTTLKAGDFFHAGATGQVDPTETWYEIESVDSDTQLTLTAVYAGTTDTGLAYTARSTLTGDLRDSFITTDFFEAVDVVGTDGDRWYVTNGVDPIMGWDGLADQAYRPDLGGLTSARSIVRFKNIMYYIAPTVSGEARLYSIRTSAIGEPENVSTKEASEFIVHDGADTLLSAMPIGDLMAIYGERSITLAQFVGAPLQFVFRTAVAGFGPRSSRAVAQFPDHHLFVGADAQYRFDGATAQPVNNHVWREVNRQTSPQRLDLLHSIFDEERGEIIWTVPLNSDDDPDEGSPQTAFVGHYLESVGGRHPMPHTQRDLPATVLGYYERDDTLTWDSITEQWNEINYRWDDQFLQASFPQILFGDISGNVFILNELSTKAGTPLNSFARFSRRPLANGAARKGIVRRIYPFAEVLSGSVEEILVRLRVTNAADGVSTQVSSLPFATNGQATAHFVAPRKSGRYCEIEFGTTQTDGYWAITGYDMDVVNGSAR